MKRLSHSRARVIDDQSTVTNSLIMSVMSFIEARILHALFIWIYHNFKKEKKTDQMLLLTSSLAQQSNVDSKKPSFTVQYASNDIRENPK